MSPREKNLLIIFGAAGLIVITFLGISLLSAKKLQSRRAYDSAREKLRTAEMYRDSRAQVADEMEWLANHEPQPAAYQDVQSTLQQLVENEARAAGLTVRPNSQKLLPTDQTAGNHFHRAKVQITVVGLDEAVYRWLDRLTLPDQFRTPTNIRFSPDREDDTKLDCNVTVEQWFVPLPL